MPNAAFPFGGRRFFSVIPRHLSGPAVAARPLAVKDVAVRFGSCRVSVMSRITAGDGLDWTAVASPASTVSPTLVTCTAKPPLLAADYGLPKRELTGGLEGDSGLRAESALRRR